MDPPTPPNEEDCCNSGCNPCIFDVYEEKLKKFRENRHNLQVISSRNCISQTAYTVFKLVRKQQLAGGAFFLTYEYVGPFRNDKTAGERDAVSGPFFRPGQHFLTKIGGTSTRAYTPIPCDTLTGLQFGVVVKVYERGVASNTFKRSKIGDESLWRGPYGDFKISYVYKHMLAIAQGTGVAPIYSVLRETLDDDNFESLVKLFYCCGSADEVLLRDELYSMLKYWNFGYELFLGSSRSADRKYNETIHESKLSQNDILSYLKDKENVQVLVCGSESFNECMLDYLKGFTREHIYVF